MPENSTSFVMTNLSGSITHIKKRIGNLYGLRTWVEYGFRHCKQELGWTDYRFTKFEQIERWWEIIFSVYLMVSLTTKPFTELAKITEPHKAKKTVINVCCLAEWNAGQAWKHSLNNLRLLIQPLISPWLDVFPNRSLLMGFHKLIHSVSHLYPHFYSA